MSFSCIKVKLEYNGILLFNENAIGLRMSPQTPRDCCHGAQMGILRLIKTGDLGDCSLIFVSYVLNLLQIQS